jgi:hypothetical protein
MPKQRQPLPRRSPYLGCLSVLGAASPLQAEERLRPVRPGVAVEQVGYTG